MPTGYTSDLYEGKEQTFADFAMSCARNFGALITLRDAAPGTPIPEKFEADSYYARSLAEAQAEEARLRNMTVAEAEVEANRIADEWEAERLRVETVRLERKARYEAMLREVIEWIPPTDEHVELRKFMIEQLQSSIEYDCSIHTFDPPTRNGAEWLAGMLADTIRRIGYYAEEHANELDRAAERTAWVQALRESLEPYQDRP